MDNNRLINKELVLTIILQEMDHVFEVDDLQECERIADLIERVSPSIKHVFEQVVCSQIASNVNAAFLYRALVMKSLALRNDAKFSSLLMYERDNYEKSRLFLFCLKKSSVSMWTLHAFQTVVNTLTQQADLIRAMFLPVSTLDDIESAQWTAERRQKIRVYLQALQLQHGDWWHDYEFRTLNDFMPHTTYFLYITLMPGAQSTLFLDELAQYLTPRDFETELTIPHTSRRKQTPLAFALTRFGSARMHIITWLLKASDINNPLHNYPLFMIAERSLSFITISDKLIDDLCAALDKRYDWKIQKNIRGRKMTAREYCEYLLWTGYEDEEERGTMTATEFCEYMLFVSPKSSQIPLLFARLYAWLQSLEIRNPESKA
jgi:hypothetical protein